MTLPPSWRLTPGQQLLHRCWEGECVLYNDLTGDTHLLGEFALALLELLRAAPLPAAGLALELGLAPGTDFPGPDDPLAAVLADLAALHLVEALPC
jgi:PqqD family protein of HPr-rel-A system